MLELLAQNQLLLLFVVIGLGYLIGNINIFGFKFGVAAVLFVGIAFGALDKNLGLPEHIYVIGLVLFVYAIGLQSGPGFFASFQRRGIRYSLIAGLVILIAAILAKAVEWILGISAPSTAGLFCGALTNTPALAATVETARNLSANLPNEVRELHANSPVVAYGLAYPFGVLGVILWLFIMGKKSSLAVKGSNVADNLEESDDSILSRTFKVTNPAIIGNTVGNVLGLFEDQGFVLSRILKANKKIDIVTYDTILDSDDLIVAVGNQEAIDRALESAKRYKDAYFVNGIGSPSNYFKKEIIINKSGIPIEKFISIIHPTASVSESAEIGKGSVIFQNATVTTNARIGNHVIVLPNSIISHDDNIGDYTCITGGVCVSGNVKIGRSCYLGTGSVIRDGLTIGDFALIGMGSVVTKDIPAKAVVAGNPARIIRYIE